MDPQCGHFLAKMCAKTKELGPAGGRAAGTPPRSANALVYNWCLLSILFVKLMESNGIFALKKTVYEKGVNNKTVNSD